MEDGENPLFDAFDDPNVSEVTLRSIASENPDRARQACCRAGHLPIHLAVVKAPPGFVRFLIQEQPGTVRERAYNGNLPIHIALRRFMDGHEFEDEEAAAAEMLETVRVLVTAWPESLQEKGCGGLLPLHAACRIGVPLPVVQYLVQCDEGAAVRASDEYGNLPLRHALEATVPSLPVVRLLVDMYPESVQTKDANGSEKVPFIRAIQYSSPDNILECLVDGWPESLRGTFGKDDRNALHYAAFYKNLPAAPFLMSRCWELVYRRCRLGFLPLHEAAGVPLDESTPDRKLAMCRFLVRCCSRALRERCIDGTVPLHRAVSVGDVPVAQFFIEKRRDSISQVSDSGWLPFHSALHARPKFDADIPRLLELVKFLYKRFPDAIEQVMNNGETSLHVAVASGRTADGRQVERSGEMEYRLANFLLEVRPSLPETSGRTRGGLSPLHFAVFHGNSLATVQLLVERQPESLRFRTPDGTSALHFAADRDEPSSAPVRYIAESAHDLFHEVDSDRWLPLHVAVDHIQPSFDVVQFLVEQNPHSVGERTALGLLPLHVAAANPAPLQVVEFLVDRRPESVDQRDRNGSLPLHSAVASPKASLDVVRYLLERRPSSVDSIDGAGLLPLHIAAVNNVPMDVLFYLATKRPHSIFERLPSQVRELQIPNEAPYRQDLIQQVEDVYELEPHPSQRLGPGPLLFTTQHPNHPRTPQLRSVPKSRDPQ